MQLQQRVSDVFLTVNHEFTIY